VYIYNRFFLFFSLRSCSCNNRNHSIYFIL